jgi:hypothetical protein
VVNKESKLVSVSAADLKRLYTGRLTQLEGVKLVPVNQALDSEPAEKFLKTWVGMTSSEYKEYWVAQQVKGGGVAPMIQKTATNVRMMVGQIPGGLGYLYPEEADSTVRILPIK